MVRIYKVVNKNTGEVTLAYANSQAQAINSVVGDTYKATVASAVEAMSLVSNGVVLIKPEEPKQESPLASL